MRVVVADDLVARAAGIFEQLLRRALADHERASLALSGGSTPWPVLERLGAAEIEWRRVDVFQVDERIAPAGHRDRNLTRLAESFLPLVPVVAHPMPVEAADLDDAAARYAAELPDRLDIVHLGLGPDGHTASLVPDDPVLEVRDRDVAVTGEYLGHRRMTLTYPAIDRAATIVWLVAGESKRKALSRLLAGDRDIPAAVISTANSIIVTDIGSGDSPALDPADNGSPTRTVSE